MCVTFPATAPEYRGWNLTVAFPARVDGREVDCTVSAEALEDHFGAASPGATDLLEAFNAHRPEIERTAHSLLRTLRTNELRLHSGHFRFALDDPAWRPSSQREA